MTSRKRRYRAGRWLAHRFAAAKWRGPAIDVLTDPAIIVGPSLYAAKLEGSSLQSVVIAGSSLSPAKMKR